jgi:hypothetical protein
LILKPHPMDEDDYSQLGIRVLTDATLREAGVALYELLGSATAMISDVSSAWVDFIALDRPVSFFLPDASDLAARRGFNVPDLLAILPGPVLSNAQDVRGFLEVLANDPTDPRLMYQDRRERIGVAHGADAPNRLLDWLDAYQRSRGQRPLFAASPERVAPLQPEFKDHGRP